jgi:hypothetical protein
VIDLPLQVTLGVGRLFPPSRRTAVVRVHGVSHAPRLTGDEHAGAGFAAVEATANPFATRRRRSAAPDSTDRRTVPPVIG